MGSAPTKALYQVCLENPRTQLKAVARGSTRTAPVATDLRGAIAEHATNQEPT